MIPRNWRWSTLENVSDVIMGQSPNGEETTSDSTYIPLIGGAADMGNLFPIITRYTKVPTKLSQKDDVIICVRATLGRPIYSDGVYCLGRGVAAIRSNILIKEYIRYFLINNEQYLYENATGSTFLQITSIKLKSMPIPVPPLDEQQRIVDIIENLFSKLDKAKALAQNVIDNYELRRSAILHKAFTGELTDTNLNITDFSEVANIKCNLVSPKDYLNYPHIAPDNIEKKTGRLTSYHTVAEDKVISNKHRFYPGQILYSKIRPYLSKVIVAEFDGLCSADMYPIESKENIKYMWYYMLSDEFLNQASNAGSRTLLPKINQKELSKIKVPICKLEEQKEIVRILDSLLNKEQRTKELAEQILQKIDLMKKAILARAFRGELKTNEVIF